MIHTLQLPEVEKTLALTSARWNNPTKSSCCLSRIYGGQQKSVEGGQELRFSQYNQVSHIHF
jgi:hypothetical protein